MLDLGRTFLQSVERSPHARGVAVLVGERVQVDASVEEHRREHVVDRELAPEPLDRLVEAHEVDAGRLAEENERAHGEPKNRN